MKTAPPQHVLPHLYGDMQKQLVRVFYEILYKRVLEVIAEANPQAQGISLKNAGGNFLRDALRSGRVQYQDGIFSGQFSAALSSAIRSLGGVWEPRRRVFHLAVAPAWVLGEAVNYQSTAKALHERIVRELNRIQEQLEQTVSAKPVDANKTIEAMDRGFKTTAEALSVKPELTPESRERLAQDYTRDVSRYIVDFSKRELPALRKVVEENANQGFRADTLVDGIKKRVGVSQRHAEFLARQETSLYLSSFRRQRFAEAGVRRYKWSTSHDERVRSSHKHLDGHIFSYSDPPITDLLTTARNNPGQDFNCRCVDIAILDPVRESVAA